MLRFGTAHHCSGVVKPAAHFCNLLDDGQHRRCALVLTLGTIELVKLLPRCFQDRVKFTAGRHLAFLKKRFGVTRRTAGLVARLV